MVFVCFTQFQTFPGCEKQVYFSENAQSSSLFVPIVMALAA